MAGMFNQQLFAMMLLSLLVMTGCSSNSAYAPISDLSAADKRRANTSALRSTNASGYTVRRGDTLYGIAFKYGLDYRQLARANNIDGSYAIYPGQKLSLKTSSVARGSDAAPLADRTTTKPQKTAKPVKTQPRATQKTASKVKNTQNETKVKKPVKKPATAGKSVALAANRKLQWRWPTKGRIVQGYSSSGKVNKGINFLGERGESVFAAESGKVVYVGSGLLGYGNLVIINHNQTYLSAYGHNSKILVRENDVVNIGDKIAEIGSSGATRNMLHFEIRRNGSPVDPKKYLPKRR
ncbi:peptidoglycan DD-metalloendopeptidase family protein [Aliamphritea ceti]|uniref:peptidoglycan DD-metalloendopeptidase family protein n=1 Tax=Aliamphritea ceti TaxID=1524258 RepID=UPI0021C30B6D|nr:peptidoglycan DD-metalloendopeptidase family protein [Aliamphritea ceti]